MHFLATGDVLAHWKVTANKSRRLSAVIASVSFKYDPFGKRIYKQSPSATSIFAYDGPNLIQTVNSSGNVVARYVEGLEIDQPLATSRSGSTNYYEADGIGSITSLTNTSGTLAASYTYDSFGNLTNSTGSLESPFRFTAREFDSETNLYFYRAREVDPNTGRFLSEDPRRFRSDANFYPYVFNSPTKYVDPYGLQKCQSGRCADCPGGHWVSGAVTGDLGVNFFGAVTVGRLVFAGVLVCTSNPSVSVPFYSFCWFGSAAYEQTPLNAPPPDKVGLDGGLGGGGIVCSGFYCTENLAGPEYGGFTQIADAFYFFEGSPVNGGGCQGGGVEADAGIEIGGGGFKCKTTTGRPIGGSK